MKKYILLLLLIIIACSCQNKTASTRIYGGINGYINDTVLLYVLNESTGLFDVIHVLDNSFNHSLNVDTLTEAMLVFSNGVQYPIYFNRGEEIRIEGDTASLDKLHVVGNLLNERLTEIIASVEALPNASVQVEMVDSFIRRNNTLPICVYLLDRYLVQRERPDYNRITNLIDVMIGDLKDKPFVQELKVMLNQVDRSRPGQIAPQFNLIDNKGGKISRSDFNKKHLLIHFWASWDSTGRNTHADLRRLNSRMRRSENFEILGISLDLDKEEWKQAIKDDTLTWKQATDLHGWESTVIKQYGVQKLPANILIGPGGRVLERDVPGDSLFNKVNRLLK